MFPMQSQMFKEVTDDWIKITERTSLWAANYQASPTKPAYDGTDLADSAIAENDLACMLKFKRFQWSTILLEERFRFGAWDSRENGCGVRWKWLWQGQRSSANCTGPPFRTIAASCTIVSLLMIGSPESAKGLPSPS